MNRFSLLHVSVARFVSLAAFSDIFIETHKLSPLGFPIFHLISLSSKLLLLEHHTGPSLQP